MRVVPILWICSLVAGIGGAGCSDTPVSSTQPANGPDVLAQTLGADPAVTGRLPLSLDCTDQGEAPPPIGDRRIPFMPHDDLQFIDYFMEHHRDAIAMADMVVERGSSAEVKALARHVRDAQAMEVRELQRTRVRITGSATAAPLPHDSHMTSEMDYMSTLAGAELDYSFLEEMIPHHGSGIAPARHAVPHLCRFSLIRMAVQIYSDQADEIARLIELLIQRSGDPAPAHHVDVDTHDGADIGLVGDRRVTFTPLNDVEFIDFFVPHHEDAVMMAHHVGEHGATPEVRSLATSIVESQSEEISIMKGVRGELTGSTEPARPPEDPMMRSMMQRMMSLSGVALDVVFLVEMIPHHASGLGPAHRARPHLAHEQLAPVADRIYTTQAKEIGEMRELLLHQIWRR